MSSGTWEWQDEHGNWNVYDSATQTQLANASGGTTTIHAPNGQAYLVDLNGKYQENTRFKTRRPLRLVPSSGGSFLSNMFGSSAPAPAPAPAASIPQWACDRCTFVNNGTDLNCNICGVGVNPKATQILQAQYGGPAPSPSPPAHPKRKRSKPRKPPTAPPSGGFFGGLGGSFGLGFGGGHEEEVESSGPRFVDPKELEAKNAREDKARIKKEKTEGNRKKRQLKVILKKTLTLEECGKLLIEQFEEAPEPTTEIPEQREEFEICQVCFCDPPNAKMITCGHQNCCTDCLKQHMEVKIRDDDIIPWICCPFPDCRAKIAPTHFDGLDPEQVVEFCRIQLVKALARNSMWVSCKNEECHFGFLIEDDNKHKIRCEICRKNQTVCRAAEQDDSIKELIKSRKIRKCPVCSELTMKDKGLCNIINCGKCNVWWNWQTRETGNSQREMKQAARARGTLWEPGELEWQRRLEQTNPAEFKKLLERNGIKWNPNYRRGT